MLCMEQIIRQIMEYLKYLDNPIAYWIGGSLSTGFFTYLFTKRREAEKRAILEFSSEPIFQELEKSVRLLLDVKYVEGELSVFNAVGYLTIEIERDGKRSLRIPEKILVKKGEEFCQGEGWIGVCEFCKDEHKDEWKKYLVPYYSPEVRWEPLCWTLPIPAGEGLDGDKYNHVTHIPVGGNAKLCLCDLYKAKVVDKKENVNKEFYLIKVHSEYGVEVRPRICLKLPLENPPDFEIIFKVKVGGENVRKIIESPELRIRWQNRDEDYVLSYGGNEKSWKLGDILGERIIIFEPSPARTVLV